MSIWKIIMGIVIALVMLDIVRIGIKVNKLKRKYREEEEQAHMNEVFGDKR